MTHNEFNKLLEARIHKTRSILLSKGKEYAVEEGDRFHNFKVAAVMNNETPEEALWGMLTKHVVSIRDICKGVVSIDNYEEKITDWIAYGILLEAILVEKAISTKNKSTKKTFFQVHYRIE